MPSLIKITQQKKHSNRYNCFFDNDERISVIDDMIFTFDLSAGKKLSEEDMIALKAEADRAFTREKAIELLSLREHAAGELRTKLLQKGYQKDAIAAAIKYLQDKNYLNDARFANLFAQELVHKKRFGPSKIREKLYQRGLSADVIQKILTEYDQDQQIENCHYHFMKKFKTHSDFESMEDKSKAIRYLQGKGFSWDVINTVFSGKNY